MRILPLLRTTLMAIGLAAAPLALAGGSAVAHTTGGMQAHDAMATVTPQSAAVYLRIENHTAGDDRLLSVSSPVAAEAGLHSSQTDSAGVSQMLPITEGIPVAKGTKHALAPGGDHIMLMGLTKALKPGDSFPLSLTFETGGTVTVEVKVVHPGEVGAAAEGAIDHSGHGTGN